MSEKVYRLVVLLDHCGVIRIEIEKRKREGIAVLVSSSALSIFSPCSVSFIGRATQTGLFSSHNQLILSLHQFP